LNLEFDCASMPEKQQDYEGEECVVDAHAKSARLPGKIAQLIYIWIKIISTDTPRDFSTFSLNLGCRDIA